MSLISTAFAAGTTTTTTSAASGNQFSIMSFLPMVIIFVLFWFLLIRPQQKKAKALNNMLSQLQNGDEVITNGGILGKITKVSTQFVSLEIANGVVITVQKATIATKLDKGTLSKAVE